MRLCLLRALVGLIGLLPLAAVRGLAQLLAQLFWWAPGRRKQQLLANLATAFPEKTEQQRRKLARKNLAAMLMTALESALLWRRSAEWIERHIVAVEGAHLLGQVGQSGRGVLIVGGHLGHWELSIYFGGWRLPIHFLYKPAKASELNHYLTRARERFGARMIPASQTGIHRALKALRNGRMVGLLFDQLPRQGRSVNAPFFGRSVATMNLPFRLIQKTGCQVLMGHALRTSGGWVIRFAEVPGLDDSAPGSCADALNRALEAEIRRRPEQYLWHYRRFTDEFSLTEPDHPEADSHHQDDSTASS